jgi:hypothetical protein
MGRNSRATGRRNELAATGVEARGEVSRLHRGYKLGAPDGIADGLGPEDSSTCRFGSHAPPAVLWGWGKMFKVLARLSALLARQISEATGLSLPLVAEKFEQLAQNRFPIDLRVSVDVLD